MASIKTSALVADIKGKIGGNVFARNKGGIYVRGLVKPLNPRSTLQQLRRAYCAACATGWGELSVQQRADWQAYALNTSWTNRLGDSINIGGEAAFIRNNTFRLMCSHPILQDAPGAYGHATATILTVSASAATQTPIITEPLAGFDGEVTGNVLGVFASMPQAGSRDMAPNRFRYLEKLVGVTGNPVAWPYTLDTWPWTYTEGQKITVALVNMDPTRRLSIRAYATATAEA